MERYPHIQDAATSVLNQSHNDVELVLISDGNDELYEAMQEDYEGQENVKTECNDENRGLSFSRNHGVEIATGDVIAFLDDDAVADEDWVSTLVDAYERHDALAVGGKMTPIWVDGEPNYLPEEFYWLVGVTHRGFPEEECEVRNTFGSNISFRRDVLEELGGFDEDLGRKGDAQVQGEETELSARMYDEYGERVWYIPEAKVGHKVFDYRTDRKWLLERAFWQGYSKRVMDEIVDDGGNQESDYLRQILFAFLPSRVSGLIRRPSWSRVDQLLMLVILTSTVGFGFIYGLLRY